MWVVTDMTRGFGNLRPVVKMAIAYPMAARFRTGLTLAMFSLVIFTLMIFAILSNLGNIIEEEPDRVSGGFDIRAEIKPELAIDDPAAVILGWNLDLLLGGGATIPFRGMNTLFGASVEGLFGSDLGGANAAPMVVRVQGVRTVGDVGDFCELEEAEIVRFGRHYGADPMTFLGLSGMGDLVLTCTGGLSRNRSLGEFIAQGKTLEEGQRILGQVAEGVYTTQSVMKICKEHGLDMPITSEVYAVLFEGKPPRQAVDDLMAKPLRPEVEPHAVRR